MTDIAFYPAGRPETRIVDRLAQFRNYEPRFFDLGMLCGLLILPTAFAGLADERLFHGVDNWLKPLKFDVALWLYLLTLVFFARFLPEATRASRRYRIYSMVVVTAVASEVAWIHGAAALGTASHFNTSPIGSILYSLMGLGAVILTSPPAVYAVSIARNRSTGLSPVLKEAVVIGLALVLPLTLMTAGTMASMGGHFVGGIPADPSGFPLFGWARDVGDLRVSHFLATHTLHVIPLFALASVWVLGTSRWPTRLFSAAFVGLVVFTFLQALNGQPFLPWLG